MTRVITGNRRFVDSKLVSDPRSHLEATRTYERIHAAVKRIPRGRVATYGQIAELAGFPRQPRLAGYALNALPDSSPVPWHRVINARGEISLRSEPGHEQVQRALLEMEGVRFDENGRTSLGRFQWRPRFPSASLRLRNNRARRGEAKARRRRASC